MNVAIPQAWFPAQGGMYWLRSFRSDAGAMPPGMPIHGGFSASNSISCHDEYHYTTDNKQSNKIQ
jgi:hypothetical protein